MLSRPLSRHPLVSIVVPSYNHRHFILTALQSALHQTYDHIELIVIDDGSTDGSAELLARNFQGDPRVRLTLRANLGAHATLNEGLAHARGEVVAILNSDDVYAPERIERMLEGARSRGGHPFFAYSALTIIDAHGARAYSGAQVDNYHTLLQKYQAVRELPFFWLGNLAMTSSNFFFSRELFSQVGPFSALRYVHDWDFALRMQEHVPITRHDEALLFYRVHDRNTIAEKNPWKRSAENAYVFASALLRSAQHGGLSKEALAQICTLNKSFAPIPVFLLLGLGRSTEGLRELLERGEIEALLPELIGSAPSDTGLLRSLGHLRAKLEQASRGPFALAWQRVKKRAARARKSWRMRGAEG